MERNVLGKGLSALIPESREAREKIQYLSLGEIEASIYQPRTFFSDERLRELADSIREKGVVQPILVRQAGEKFEIIAGERRFRASQLAGLESIPAIIREVKDEDLLEISLIENIQREELNKLEEAKAYRRLAGEFGLTHELIAQKVSKDRATISNMLRLLDLPVKIQEHLEQRRISAGHAKSILSISDERKQMRLCNRIIKKGLSVREAENWARKLSGPAAARKTQGNRDVHIMSAEEVLQHHLGTRVQIAQGKKRGKIVIDYYSQEDLNRLLTIIGPTV